MKAPPHLTYVRTYFSLPCFPTSLLGRSRSAVQCTTSTRNFFDTEQENKKLTIVSSAPRIYLCKVPTQSMHRSRAVASSFASDLPLRARALVLRWAVLDSFSSLSIRIAPGANFDSADSGTTLYWHTAATA